MRAKEKRGAHTADISMWIYTILHTFTCRRRTYIYDYPE